MGIRKLLKKSEIEKINSEFVEMWKKGVIPSSVAWRSIRREVYIEASMPEDPNVHIGYGPFPPEVMPAICRLFKDAILQRNWFFDKPQDNQSE